MRSFDPKLLRISGGEPTVLPPVEFSGRVDELTLEKWIVGCPDLVGEPLLVLGRQLAEFAEDQDRLDVLAIDRNGEIVLLELKVTENFRVTDLQALAYAGVYATMPTEDLARTLLRTLEKSTATPATAAEPPPAAQGADVRDAPDGAEQPVAPAGDCGDATVAPTTVTVDEAKQRIVDFIDAPEFAVWEPSQHVRIKLVAPSFPKRVLKTVKWLGDVYDMPVEAISVRLFEHTQGNYSIAFERLLPLPGEDEFDMTVRQREDRKREENTSRREQVLPLLLKAGVLNPGDRLYLNRSALPVDQRDLFDPADVVYQVEVEAEAGSKPKFKWRANNEQAPETLSPSAVTYNIYKTTLAHWQGEPFYTGVATYFTVEPGGKTLEDLALENGLWT